MDDTLLYISNLTNILNISNKPNISKVKFKKYFKYHKSQYSFHSKDENINKLIESSLHIFNAYLAENPLSFMQSTYHDNICKHAHNLLDKQIQNENNNDTKQDIDKIIKICFALFYKYIVPKRSYPNTFIRKHPNRIRIKNKIQRLQSIEQPTQRTNEWYIFRHNTLTASNIWKVFISDSTRNQLIYEKCEPIDTEKFKHVSLNSPLHWGQKYEPLSVMYYEKTYNTTVGDFGCISHADYEYIAASPDGINIDDTSPLYGRMLEIKNTVSRVITGIPKLEYWIQMQIQMEVCDLNECDFLEMKFTEYEGEEEFYADGDTFEERQDKSMKGIIIQFAKDNNPYYEYMPLGISKSEFEIWEQEIVQKNQELTWMRNIYWKLEKISCVLVLRNKSWFKAALPQISELWETVLKERDGDYQHRAPKKRQKKEKKSKNDNNSNNTNNAINTNNTNNAINVIKLENLNSQEATQEEKQASPTKQINGKLEKCTIDFSHI
jgi:putative phage-type endonuclease